MSKPLAEVHVGRLSVPIQALTFSIANVLKDLDPLIDENISISKHDFSKWAARNCESIASQKNTRDPHHSRVGD